MPMRPRRWMWPGMMPILHSSGVITPGQFGPISRVRPPRSARLTVTMSSTGMPSVMHTTSGTPASAASNGIGGKRRRHIDDAGIALGRGARFGNRVEDRQVEMARAAFARRHAADHLGAVGDRLLGMKRALGAGEALADNPGGGVDEDRHHPASLTAATILWAASARFSA